LVHVHGLAYTPDGKRLLIPSHRGLAVYSGGRWSKAPGPEHDFMGFTATRVALYSSGHPAPGSSLQNPFGLVKSTDGGRSWIPLGLTGESDFHVMAAGYGTGTIYVHSPAVNSRMREPGIHHTSDDGKTWTRSAADRLSGGLMSLAVHPRRGNVVAAVTDAGLFVSENLGDQFTAVAASQPVSAMFDQDGAHLWFGGYAAKATLTRLDLKTQERVSVAIPDLTQDAIAYIAQNPATREQYAIATFKRDVFVSNDSGRTWKQIAAHGETR
ncbi:MAG: F510_1955 family glycosylhydrolase, partial [Usitatibacter sp.]